MPPIDTDKISESLRRRAIDVTNQKVLITRLAGSQQEPDITEPVNCGGYGRIRHFRRKTSEGWPQNPLPIDPAANKLGIPTDNVLRAQVFQNAACNWRCWYCYVPFDLLAASAKKAAWFSAAELLDLHEKTPNAPNVIDLSGGQPDLTPEWTLWMIRELRARGLDSKIYLWSDDNLSNDYLTRFLSRDDLKFLSSYRSYGKVCCFKGFDRGSFAFNTGAEAQLFDRQFDLFREHLRLGLDLYAYTTFTSPTTENIEGAMSAFVDRLQSLHANLPLRTVPLEIRHFAPMQQRRMQAIHEDATKIQQTAIQLWNKEIEKRFSTRDRKLPIYEVPLT